MEKLLKQRRKDLTIKSHLLSQDKQKKKKSKNSQKIKTMMLTAEIKPNQRTKLEDQGKLKKECNYKSRKKKLKILILSILHLKTAVEAFETFRTFCTVRYRLGTKTVVVAKTLKTYMSVSMTPASSKKLAPTLHL